MAGTFIISLDFELYWGVRDRISPEAFQPFARRVHELIPGLLHLFEKFNLKATFGTVGFIFAENLEELHSYLPERKPQYADSTLSPYPHIVQGSPLRKYPEMYFAPHLINEILDRKKHEIASHTFSHYYPLAAGACEESFLGDMQAMNAIANKFQISLQSIIFPRNQIRPEFLSLCSKNGILAYRGNPDCYAFRDGTGSRKNLVQAALRCGDCYVPLYNTTFAREVPPPGMPMNVPSSRFLRPYTRLSAVFQKVKLHRILSEMTSAAQSGSVYHLWWHPHNFSSFPQQNLTFLTEILRHYEILQSEYDFQSATLSEIALRGDV